MRGRRNRLREPRVIDRRIIARKEKPSKWWSDPTRLIPLVISGAALFLSYLSWQESHRGRLINEEISRPVLSLIRIDTDPVRAGIWRFPDKVIAFAISLKNIGKSTAELSQIKVDITQDEQTADECKQHTDLEEQINESETRYRNVIFLPGVEQQIEEHVVMTIACENKSGLRFHISLEVDYTDVVTNTKYSQFLGQQIDVSMDELKLKLRDQLEGPIPKPKPSP